MDAIWTERWRWDAARKTQLSWAALLLALLASALTVYFCFKHKFLKTPERINGWAILLSVTSILALAGICWLLKRFVPAAAANSEVGSLPRRQRVIALVLASVWIALCLPATFRAVMHPREVMVFWHDEGITLESVQAFVTGATVVPQYRWTQGWVTFLPVALPLKVLHQAVPVDYALTNIAMRAYQLLTVFGIIFFSYRLIWQISRSWWLAGAVVLIAYSRPEFFQISLAIDRPDTFQLLFVLLALINAHRFWVDGQPGAWFLAVFFAAFAFASKYSGHLLVPVLLLPWIAHWRRPEVQTTYPTRWRRWGTGAAIFVLSIGLIFPLTFFTLSPYHLIRLEEVLEFFQTYLPIYKSGNVYNLPDHQMPSHLSAWWGVFTSRYVFDYWLTILGAIGAAAALVKNLIQRCETPQRRGEGEWLLLAWGVCYISFLVYQYGLVDYRYIMPVQFVLPFFLLLPILWLQRSSGLGRVPYRTGLGFAAVAAVILLCSPRVEATLQFLAGFRSEASAQACFDVGHWLDRRVGPGEDPNILLTNLAYIPPRFKKLSIHNVDVTKAFIAENRFDFIVMSSNMFDTYANKPTAGCEEQYDPLYKVHYVDVVEAYTAFKNKTHPDYRFVACFGDYLFLYERVDAEHTSPRR